MLMRNLPKGNTYKIIAKLFGDILDNFLYMLIFIIK